MSVIPALLAETELEDYEALLASPGWARLCKWAETECTEQIARHSEAAADSGDVQALALLRRAIAGKRALLLLTSHPTDRIVTLKNQRPAQPSLDDRVRDLRTGNFYR
jgi:hypothetical protein